MDNCGQIPPTFRSPASPCFQLTDYGRGGLDFIVAYSADKKTLCLSFYLCTPGSNTSFQNIIISIRKWKKFHPLCLCLWGRLCNPGSHIFVSCLCLCLCLYQALTHDDNSGNNHDEMVRTRCLLPRQRQTKCSQKKRLGEG